MKNIILIVCLFSLNAFSETYICNFVHPPTYDGDITLYETHRFVREGKKFTHEVDYVKKYDLEIYNETFEDSTGSNFTISGDQYLILGRSFVVFKIDKIRLKATENYLYVTGDADTAFADCKLG